MHPKSSCVAIITARGGSKRIPRKNIKSFLSKPIIAYSIEAAKKSNCFNEIMVSTDDEEIASVAKMYGAKIPFFRTMSTSDDFSSTTDVLLEVLLEYKKNGLHFDYACCLYPAAPFITEDLIIAGLKKMVKVGASSLIPVAAYPASIWRALKIEQEKLIRIWPENEMKRSQDLTSTFYDVGQFYWLNVNDFLNQRKLLTTNTTSLILRWNQVQDIDTLEDWAEAEFKYQFLLKNK